MPKKDCRVKHSDANDETQALNGGATRKCPRPQLSERRFLAPAWQTLPRSISIAQNENRNANCMNRGVVSVDVYRPNVLGSLDNDGCAVRTL